ncbi:MAG: GNAT family N-acetyltransferase [Gammaproteobacteria bacterium]
MTGLRWSDDLVVFDWNELSELYRIAPLGEKKPRDLERSFANSLYRIFARDGGRLVAAGRALADGVDCSYICDIAVHPQYQGRRIGQEIVTRLRDLSAGHRKIILYANPGNEDFYAKLGFRRMRTAMAIFKDQAAAITGGLVEKD